MKKLTTLLLLVCAVLTAGAFDLKPGQYLLGNSTSDDYYNYGRAPYLGDVLVGASIYPDSYNKLQNLRALGIRFCLPEGQSEPVEVKCVTLHDSNIDPIKEQAPKNPIVEGWNYVEFDEPLALDPKGTFISYTYKQTANNFGICNWEDPAAGGFWLYLFNTQTQKWTWGNFSSQYGAVCIQLVVEAELPNYDVSITDVYSAPAAKGGEATSVVYLKSNSKNSISDLDYTVTIDGKTTEVHRTLSSPIESGLNREVGLEVAYQVPETEGTYTVNFALTKLNGEALEKAVTWNFDQEVYSRIVARRTVVEEFTGTGCGWCPRGYVGMEYMKEHYPDKFIGIAVHKYNNDDPMYCAYYCNPGFGGAPTCVMDRKQTMDPYNGTGYGVIADLEYYNSILPPVDVTVKGTFAPTMKSVSCEADIEFLTKASGYSLAFVITADDLYRPNWTQANYYANQSAASVYVQDDMTDLQKFCQGGEWVGGRGLHFNDVMIGSTYSTTGSNSVTGLGSTVRNPGTIINRKKDVALRCNDGILSILDKDKVYVVCLVMDKNGQIANAARAKVEIPEGIDTVLANPAEDSQMNSATYDLQGKLGGGMIQIRGGKKILNR